MNAGKIHPGHPYSSPPNAEEGKSSWHLLGTSGNQINCSNGIHDNREEDKLHLLPPKPEPLSQCRLPKHSKPWSRQYVTRHNTTTKYSAGPAIKVTTTGWPGLSPDLPLVTQDDNSPDCLPSPGKPTSTHLQPTDLDSTDGHCTHILIPKLLSIQTQTIQLLVVIITTFTVLPSPLYLETEAYEILK